MQMCANSNLLRLAADTEDTISDLQDTSSGESSHWIGMGVAITVLDAASTFQNTAPE